MHVFNREETTNFKVNIIFDQKKIYIADVQNDTVVLEHTICTSYIHI